VKPPRRKREIGGDDSRIVPAHVDAQKKGGLPWIQGAHRVVDACRNRLHPLVAGTREDFLS
jgi:hypothetical protein